MNGSVHPMVIFWLGVLTGAILVALVFFYKVLVPTDYQSSLFNSTWFGSGTGTSYSSLQLAPKSIGSDPSL